MFNKRYIQKHFRDCVLYCSLLGFATVGVNLTHAQLTLKYGDCLRASISAAAEIDVYTFSGYKNDRIILQMSEITGSMAPQIELWQNGIRITQAVNDHSARLNYVLPDGGDYIIFALDGSDGTKTGTYGIYLQRTLNPGQAMKLACGSTLPDTISFAACMNAYTFSVSQAQKTIIQMASTSGSLTSKFELYSPTGTLMAKKIGNPTARFDSSLGLNGTYTIIAMDGFDGTKSGIYSLNLTCVPLTSVGANADNLTIEFELTQNYPNPFSARETFGNPSTTILYDLPRAGQVEITIFNLLGEQIRRLVNEPQAAGQHRLQWDGRNENGKSMPSGVYLYRLRAGEFVQTRKMVLAQ